MDKDINGTTIQTVVGLAALVELLADKGVITEAEYNKKFEETKKKRHGFDYRRNEKNFL